MSYLKLPGTDELLNKESRNLEIYYNEYDTLIVINKNEKYVFIW